MKPTNLTVKLLEEIRDAARETNARIDQTNALIDQTNARIDQTNARIGQTNAHLGETYEGLSHRIEALTDRVVEGEIRTATMMTGIAGTLQDMKTLLEDRLELRGRVERCEQNIEALKGHTGLK